MYVDYMEKLIDARWASGKRFQVVSGRPEYREILETDLFYIYDSVVAFNRPVINDSRLVGCFDFAATQRALIAGELDQLLKFWTL
jgi:hypothetical protein